VKFKTRCSQTWKARVSEQWLRAQGVRAVEQWIGISAEEIKRIRPTRRAWLRLRYPLVELEMTRADCLHLIGAVGWPMPERSSCYICPMRSLGDWRRLAARNPTDFAKAVEVERELQRVDPDVFLHPTARPLNVAVNGCRQPRAEVAPAGCEPGLFSCS
jgi:PP-loop superfamily ATP-utilizing enzyme